MNLNIPYLLDVVAANNKVTAYFTGDWFAKFRPLWNERQSLLFRARGAPEHRINESQIPDKYDEITCSLTEAGIDFKVVRYYSGDDDIWEATLLFEEYPLDAVAYSDRSDEMAAEERARRLPEVEKRRAEIEARERAELARLLSKYGNPAGGW